MFTKKSPITPSGWVRMERALFAYGKWKFFDTYTHQNIFTHYLLKRYVFIISSFFHD